jgi:hypothetical protein
VNSHKQGPIGPSNNNKKTIFGQMLPIHIHQNSYFSAGASQANSNCPSGQLSKRGSGMLHPASVLDDKQSELLAKALGAKGNLLLKASISNQNLHGNNSLIEAKMQKQRQKRNAIKSAKTNEM